MGPLPEGSTRRRLYCCDACRVYASRDRSVTESPQLALPLSVDTSLPPSNTATAPSAAPPPSGPAPARSLAAIAAGIPTPADEYGPARAYCEVREGGHGVVFGRLAGRVNEPAGPVFPRPRQAIDLAGLLNERLGAA